MLLAQFKAYSVCGYFPVFLHKDLLKSCCLVTQLRLTLCDPMGCTLSGSSVHEILQARILEWVTISFSRDLPGSEVKPASPTL